MKTALVTGASGYLGSQLCKNLKLAGYRIVGLDIKHTTNRYIDIFYPCDVTDRENLKTLFSKIKIDIVFHLAGKIEVGESVLKPTMYFLNNTAGTVVLLDVMNEFGVKNIVYSSTAGLYKSSFDKLTEESELCPTNNPYATSKYSAELAIKSSGLNYVIFRYFNLAGADVDLEFGEEHQPETHLIPRILQNLNNFTVYGDKFQTPDGTCVRDYVHVEDVADAHILAADHLFHGKQNLTLNLGTGQGYSVMEIIKCIEDTLQLKVNYVITEPRAGDPDSLVSDISMAEKHLNFIPAHNLKSILKTAYGWQTKE